MVRRVCGSFMLFQDVQVYLFIWLWWVFVAVPGLSLIAVSEGYNLGAVCGLFIVITSPVVEQGWALG